MHKADELEKELFNVLYESATIAKKELNYNPIQFFSMLENGGAVLTAKKLLNAKHIPNGFSKLWEYERLDLSLEAIILNPKWKHLFNDDEIEEALKRLREANFDINKLNYKSDKRHIDQFWSKEELYSAVEAYIYMLNKEKNKQPYNKSEINRQLRESKLNNRSKSSIEYRMQNISAVLDAFCLPKLKGYLPAKNIGTNIFNQLKTILEEKKIIDLSKYNPTEDLDDYEERAAYLLEKIEDGIPLGIINPEKVNQTVSLYRRDP